MIPFGSIQQNPAEFMIELDDDYDEEEIVESLDDLRMQYLDYASKISRSWKQLCHLDNGLPPYAWDEDGKIYSPESESTIWLDEVQKEWKRLQSYRSAARDLQRRIKTLENCTPAEHAVLIAREERTIVVGNIKGLSKSELILTFGRIGAIDSVDICNQKNLCKVTYRTKASAMLAQSLHHSRLFGHRLTVHMRLRGDQSMSSVPPNMCLDAMPFPFTLAVSSGVIGGWSPFFHDGRTITRHTLAEWYLINARPNH